MMRPGGLEVTPQGRGEALIEVQTDHILSEDDIIRYEDLYARTSDITPDARPAPDENLYSIIGKSVAAEPAIVVFGKKRTAWTQQFITINPATNATSSGLPACKP
jgi:hypothetical protein